MGCVQSYFKRAQTSLSPSSTHDSERKPLDDGSPIHEITRQPISSIREESEDRGGGDQDRIHETNNNEGGEKKSSLHCVGVEATAVRQLAASTGTVAILGTTAKVLLRKSDSGNLIEEETTENADIVEVVIEHNNIIPSSSGPLHQTIEAIAKEVKIQNGSHKPIADILVKSEIVVSENSTINNNALPSADEKLNSAESQKLEDSTININKIKSTENQKPDDSTINNNTLPDDKKLNSIDSQKLEDSTINNKIPADEKLNSTESQKREDSTIKNNTLPADEKLNSTESQKPDYSTINNNKIPADAKLNSTASQKLEDSTINNNKINSTESQKLEDSTIINNKIPADEKLNSTESQKIENITNVSKEDDSNVHITSELTNNFKEEISISEQNNNVSNVNIAPSNLDNQTSKPNDIVTKNLESKIPKSNIETYDSAEKAPSLEQKPILEEVRNDVSDQSSTNNHIETRTNNNVVDKQTKVPLAKHFKQEVNTSEVIAKQKSKSSKESSLEKENTFSSFGKEQSIDSNKTDVTNLSKTSSLEQYSENVAANHTPLTKLPSIDKTQLSTVSDTVEEIIASATSIVLEKSKAKLNEKPQSELETFETEGKKSMSHDLDSDSNGTSDQTVISQESLNEENTREGVTNVTISKNTRNKSVDQETETEQENVRVVNGELKEEMKKEILPDINGIIQAAEEHVKNYKEQLDLILENGVPDEDSVSLRSKNSFDQKNSFEEVVVNEVSEVKDKVPPVIVETLPKKIMKKELSLSLTSQTDESSIEISPENDVSNTVSDTSEPTKDNVFSPQSGHSEKTPQHDETPLSEEKNSRIDFPLSDSMMDDLKKEIDGICEEAVSRIATATTTIQAGFRGYKTRKSLKQTNDGGAQESFDGADLPPPDLERLGSINEDDGVRPPLEEVPDFDTDPDFPVPPTDDSFSDSLSSAATKIQAGVRGYLTRKQVKQGSSTTVPSDSDFSETSVTSQDPIRTSTDLETQVQRVDDTGRQFRGVSSGKRMSLDSNMREIKPFRPPLRSVMSLRDEREEEDPQEIWRILTQEADKAAVLIQSQFRGYQARKKLSRGDAVHMPTTSSSATPSSARSEDQSGPGAHRGTGEFHDSVFASPPTTSCPQPELNLNNKIEEKKTNNNNNNSKRRGFARKSGRNKKRRK